MPARNRYAQYVLWLHAVVSGVFAILLLVSAGRLSVWVDWPWFDPTMAKMLGAALLALCVGSLLATRDPFKYRVVIQMEIVYTVATAVAVLYRLLRFSSTTPDFTWAVFASCAIFCLLFSVTYPSAVGAGGEAAAARGITAQRVE
jgi:hypothetical protein